MLKRNVVPLVSAALLWASLPAFAGQTDTALGLHSDGGGWGFRRADKPDPQLPRVLLVGDSVMNSYRAEVARLLAGKANVDTWATGMHLGDEHLISDLTKVLQQGPYAVIHFNIGLHDWPEGRIPPAQYEPLMVRYFNAYLSNAPASKLIWASSTPVTAKGVKTLDPKINPIILRQNEIAARVAKARSVPVNDLYTLGAEHLELARGDQFHWNAPGARLFAEQVSRHIAAFLNADVSPTLPAARPAAPQASGGASDLEAWRQLRYGMFITFGMSTFIGNEYGTGQEQSSTYAPTSLDVDQWIQVAQAAGMKYAVLVAKHVAGHCLWDSKVPFRGREFDHDVATSGNKTDVVAAFVAACKQHGLTPGLYWCLQDHRNNSKPAKSQRTPPLPDDFFQLAQDQLTELTQRYPDVSYYWLDIPVAASAAQRQALYDLIKRQRPGTVVLFNHGAGKPQGPMTIANCQSAWPTDVLNTERWPLKPGWFQPEQTWQGRTYRLGYEHCDTICQHWFWVEGDSPRPVADLARLYRDTVAAGGNLLLNVPPDRTGRIPDYHVKTLMDLKQALAVPSSNRQP